MKTSPASLHHRASSAALATVFIAISSSAHAQSWDGGGTALQLSWGTAANWNPDTLPAFNNTTDLVFDSLTKPDNNIGAARTIRSITYGANMDGAFNTNLRTFDGGASATLTMDAASGNASITIDSGATGNLSLGWSGVGTAGGTLSLTDTLDVTHNGTGEFLISRQVSGAGGITKLGTGTMRIAAANANSFTGAVNVNAGRLIMASTNGAGSDLNTSSGITLGGGILEIRTTNALSKQINPSLTVSSASTLAYNNTAATDQSLTMQTGTMALNGNLTVQNISTSSAGNNIINITRNLTGNGNLIVETYNNVASGAVSFSNGRVQLSGDNTAWTGNLVVAKGTAQFSGTNSFVPTAQSITLGTTGNAFGAALGFNQGNTDSNVTNAITVTTGGVRLIRNNSGPGTTANITLSGAIDLEGSLTLDHAGLGAGKSITVSGNATGAGGLNVTFVGPHAVANSSVRLTGTNDYTGATTVGTGATLIIDSSGAINGTSGVTIDAGEFRYSSSTALTKAVTFSTTGGTLSGDGTITPAVNITTGNVLAIGNGAIGTMSFGGALTVGGTYLYELNNTTNAADLGDVLGNLTLGGILDLVQLGAYAEGDKFTLFAYDGTRTGLFTTTGLVNIADDTDFTDGGGLWNLNYNDTTAGLNGGSGTSYVTITAVPEPNVAALLGGLGTLALLRRRRA